MFLKIGVLSLIPRGVCCTVPQALQRPPASPAAARLPAAFGRKASSPLESPSHICREAFPLKHLVSAVACRRGRQCRAFGATAQAGLSPLAARIARRYTAFCSSGLYLAIRVVSRAFVVFLIFKANAFCNESKPLFVIRRDAPLQSVCHDIGVGWLPDDVVKLFCVEIATICPNNHFARIAWQQVVIKRHMRIFYITKIIVLPACQMKPTQP